jgi:predicted DsbA family dithiol-disulfide isomerase
MCKSVFLKLLTFGLSLFVSNLSFAATGSSAPSGSDAVVAEVDGAKLTVADFERKNPGGFFHARNIYYEAQRKVVDQFIDQYLLERQAKKEGVTVEQLLKNHLDSAIPKDPSEEALRVYYEGVETTQPYEAVRGQIVEAIRQRRLAKARSTYMDSLRKEAKIAVLIAQPRAPMDLANAPVRGRANAPVVMVEYADYECPYCQQLQPALDKLQAEYKDKLTFAFKDFPLPTHANAQKASEAAHCAGAQGKYWEYHDLLFSTKQLAVPQLKEHARALKLDSQAFDKCLDSGEQAALIKGQAAEVIGFGLQGTPSFMINGRFFGNGSSYEELRKIIEEELGASSPAAQPRDTAKR